MGQGMAPPAVQHCYAKPSRFPNSFCAADPKATGICWAQARYTLLLRAIANEAWCRHALLLGIGVSCFFSKRKRRYT